MLLSVPAVALAQDAPARLQVIHASLEPSLQKLDLFVQDSFPDSPLNPPLGAVSYGKSSGYLKVPSGKHKLIVCRAKTGGSCIEGSYELEPKTYGTVIFIGLKGQDSEGSLTLVPQQGPAIADLETQRRFPSATGRRLSVLNGIEESQPMEVCLKSGPKSGPNQAVFGQKKRPFKGESIFSFGHWAGLGEIIDQDLDAAYGTHVDIPKGRLPLELRNVGDEPCQGAIWAVTGLEKPEDGMTLAIAVGDAQSQNLPRELVSCSEPLPPKPSECFRHRLRSPDTKP